MKIIYEDKEILVIVKEAGLPVQTGKTYRKDVVSILKNHLAAESSDSGKQPYLGIVHRLDQPVEGLLVFAKTQKSAAALSAQAAAKVEMEKEYQALVSLDGTSYPQAIEGMKKEIMLVDWLGRDTSSNTAYITSEEEKGAKRAELVFRTLSIKDSEALLRIVLHTGRHHQIRVQMAGAGMPIIGDRKYGRKEELADSNMTPGRRGLCLCASRLGFLHPVTKKNMEFSIKPSFLP